MDKENVVDAPTGIDAALGETEDTLEKPSEPSPVDTEPEPSKDDTVPEPAEPNYQTIFEEQGLGSQFKDVEDLIRRTPDSNRWNESLHKTNQVLQRELEDYRRRVAEEQKAPSIDPEKFIDTFNSNPIEALRHSGFVTKDDLANFEQKQTVLEQRGIQRDLADAVGEYPELKDIASGLRLGQQPVPGMNKYWDAIERVALKYPGIDRAGASTALQVLFPEARKLVDVHKKPPVEKVPTEDKDRAKTTPSAKAGDGGIPDFGKMTSEQIRSWYESRDLAD